MTDPLRRLGRAGSWHTATETRGKAIRRWDLTPLPSRTPPALLPPRRSDPLAATRAWLGASEGCDLPRAGNVS